MLTMRIDLDEPWWLRPRPRLRFGQMFLAQQLCPPIPLQMRYRARKQGEHPDRLGGEVTRFVAVIDRDLCLHVLVGWC